jgi:hypothetical protein
MPKMMIAIGLGKPGKDEEAELSEYEQGAQDMRDRCCALAEMYESGKRPSRSLSKMIDKLPLDDREEEPPSKPSGKGRSYVGDAYSGDEEDED